MDQIISVLEEAASAHEDFRVILEPIIASATSIKANWRTQKVSNLTGLAQQIIDAKASLLLKITNVVKVTSSDEQIKLLTAKLNAQSLIIADHGRRIAALGG